MARSTRRSIPGAAAALVGAALVVGLLVPGPMLAADASPPRGADPSVKLIVTYKAPPSKANARAVERLGGTVNRQLTLVDGLAVEVPRGQIKKLEADPSVETVEADGRLSLFDHGPNTGDLEYENAWGVEHIGTREVHLAGNTGQGIKVAVIDTGIDYIHDDPDDTPYVVDPEFLGNYAGGYDFFNGDADPYDDNGHGTHVAGILAAEKNGYLVTGVAPGVELYALKVLSAAGEGDYSGLIEALGWAVDHDMDVVNMSLGGHEVSAALQTAITEAYQAGITLVAASGNVNPASWQELLYGCAVAYPAAYDEVIAVSFTGTNDRLTGFSCTGTQVDFAAPGDQIYSPVPVGPAGSCMFCTPYGYSAQSGTSMASPHVAGLAALVLHAGIADDGDGLLADDVKAHLCANTMPAAGMATTDPRYPKWYGCGIVDADKALIDNPPPPPADVLVAADDDATTDEDTEVDIDVVANDTDPDGSAITVTALTDPARGSATIDVDGTVRYIPDADLNGTDSFDYTITNAAAETASGTVTVTVLPINDDPVATDDDLVTTRDTAAAVDVLANDTDIDGDALTVTTVGAAAHGSAVLGVGGSITYTPQAGYSGPDAFTYAIADGAGGSANATVLVDVIAVNSPPTAGDDVATTDEDESVTIDVLANDIDPDGGALTVTAVGTADHGTAAIDGDGDVVYTPAPDYHGPDSFTYTVADQVGAMDVGTVSVTVDPANDPPNAVNDSTTTSEDTGVVIDAAGNDTDPDGDDLSVVSVGAAAAGTATVEPDGRIRYTPIADVYGSDSFSYTVSDGAGGTDVGTVSVTITAANDIPVAHAKTVATPYQTAVAVTMSGADVETCDLTFQVVTPPAHGSLGTPSSVLCVTLLPPYSDSSKITYTPAAGYSGPDSFTYRVSDGTAWSQPATVAITVTSPNLIHVADLDGSRALKATTWTATVTIKVHNAAHGLVNGATVTGAWSAGASGTASCKTNSTGTCKVSKANIPRSTTSVTFSVTGMTIRASAYDPTANHDPDADSNGTVIIVPQ